MYRATGDKLAYTRQLGFSKLQHEQMVLAHVHHHGRIQRNEVMELCHLGAEGAKSLLEGLKGEGRLAQHGTRRGAVYTLAEHERRE